ncbi:MAG: sigma-70 family RNA polymerase sigma factor [Blastocatellia bacterium]
MPDELTVGELLKKCSKRPPDQAAWDEFVRRYHMTIRSFIRRTYHQKTGNDPERGTQFPDDTIDDLVQTVYLKLVDGGSSALERFEGEHEHSIFKYLGMISMNVVIDYVRWVKADKRPRVTISIDEMLLRGDVAFPEDSFIATDSGSVADNDITFIKDEIEQALNKVVKGKNRDRNILIFKLRFYEGLTFGEITKVLNLGLSPVSIGSILNRIVAHIKPILARTRGIRL